jgi:signal transduction histidine kinase
MKLVQRILRVFVQLDDPEYRAAQVEEDLQRACIMLIYVGVVYPLFYGLDLCVHPRFWREFGLVRLTHALLATPILLLVKGSESTRFARRAAMLLSTTATLAVAWMCAVTGGFSSLYLVGLIICFLAVTTIEIFRPAQLVTVLLAHSLAYALLCFGIDDRFHAPELLAAIAFLAGAVLFCVVSAALFEMQRRALFKSNRLLRLQNAELDRARRHQTQFLNTVSHELRSPVNSVLGFVELIEQREAQLHDKSRSNLRRITESSHRLLSFINDLLDLSKAEAGCMELRPSVFDLMVVVQEVAEASRALTRNRELSVEAHGPPQLFVRSDELRVRQILTNLASNAVKFTEHGIVSVRVLVEQGVTIEVSDTGPGIPPESRSLIFEAFRQLGESSGGTGLGLNIVQRLTELLGGRIELESEVGRGSTFRVHLGQIAREMAA